MVDGLREVELRVHWHSSPPPQQPIRTRLSPSTRLSRDRPCCFPSLIITSLSRYHVTINTELPMIIFLSASPPSLKAYLSNIGLRRFRPSIAFFLSPSAFSRKLVMECDESVAGEPGRKYGGGLVVKPWPPASRSLIGGRISLISHRSLYLPILQRSNFLLPIFLYER